MKNLLTLSLLLTLAPTTEAKNCAMLDAVLPLSSQMSELSQTIQVAATKNVCEELKKVKTSDDLKAVINLELRAQTQKISQGAKDRHTVGRTLNQCTPSKNSTTLVINFAGTGAYEPRTFHVMRRLIQCNSSPNVPKSVKEHAYYSSMVQFKSHLGRDAKWSGIEAGPMQAFLTDPMLQAKAKDFSFNTFPSEESEIIANPYNLSWSQLKKVPREVAKANASLPTGIINAIRCTAHYFQKAKEMNIKPKLMVMSHSSGGRSAVKFLEHLKTLVNPVTMKRNYTANLVMTLDPVKEAHHAIEEVASQYAGQIGHDIIDSIPFVELDDKKPINVWTRKQPQSLYKTTNARRWVSVYQNVDQKGLGISAMPFGIHGSPIENADQNLFVTGLGRDAHGSIVNDEKVLKLLKTEVLKL